MKWFAAPLRGSRYLSQSAPCLSFRFLLLGCLILLGLAGCQTSSIYTLEIPPVADGLGPSARQPDLPPEAERTRLIPVDGEAIEDLDAKGPLRLSVEQAVVLALRNNRALGVEQLNPIIAGAFEEIERAVFDPALFATASIGRDEVQQVSRATGTSFAVEGQDTLLEAGVTKRFATGTQAEAVVSHNRSFSNRTPDQHAVRTGLSLTQALLRGADISANLARIRQAELDTLASEYQLRGFAEALVAEVESTYWDYILARRRIEIFENSLEIARQQQNEAQQRIAVGTLPETELAAVQAEVARRRQDLIDTRSNLERLRLQLLRLLNPHLSAGWDHPLETVDRPAAPAVRMDAVAEHVALALKLRPDLNEARLQVARGDLEVIQTRNGLLPRLDLFITLGKTGFADSFSQAARDVSGPNYDLLAGLQLAYTLGNRQAEALHRQAGVSRLQAAESLNNLAQLVSLDVRTAYLEVQRAQAQIQASAVTRKLQEEALRAESSKFRVGKSTAVVVAQAQRDLLASQIAEIEAVIALRKAVIDLYRLEGSLLKRRAIQAPGGESVED